MLRRCKYCGRQYEGDPGSSCCPDCAAEQRKTTIRDRICRECGAVFPGGPRAWYCPKCRYERRREADKRYKREGSKRPIGSTDICTVCGKPYVVTGSLQKYCPDCAEEATNEVAKALKREWNAENYTADLRRDKRKQAAVPIACEVCAKLFVPRDASITCSPECSKKLDEMRHRAWEKANREKRNAYRREKRKKERMSEGRESVNSVGSEA